jgi:Sulfotransferase family
MGCGLTVYAKGFELTKIFHIMKIITFALRRSGSTAFWKVFDSNQKYFALDEPCNPKLAQLPHIHHKGTWGNFIKIYNASPEKFRQLFSPIPESEELNEYLSDSFEVYIKYLLYQQKSWFMDLTRCHLKVKLLSDIFPDAKAIHLYRKPSGFVSSHMIPSYGGVRAVRDRILNKYVFWYRRRGYNMWSIENIYNSWFHTVVSYFPKLGLPETALEVKGAYEKLLLYWLFHYRFMEKYGRKFFNGRFFTLCFDEFCENPSKKLSELSGCSSDEISHFDLSHLKSVSPGYKIDNKRWKTSMTKVGFSHKEIEYWL